MNRCFCEGTNYSDIWVRSTTRRLTSRVRPDVSIPIDKGTVGTILQANGYATGGRSVALGHQCCFKRKSRTSAYAPTPDISLRRSAADMLTRDEARRIAANIAKLPELIIR